MKTVSSVKTAPKKTAQNVKMISLIIPCLNEVESLPTTYERVSRVCALITYDYEIIFVDDGSSDGTPALLEQLAKKDPRVKFIQFSRNFGKELATTAGLHYAQGDAAVILDADLQHPPELIPRFIHEWEAGAEIVVGVRQNDSHEGIVKKLGSRAYYWLNGLISQVEHIPRETDFRLLDRVVINEFNKFSEHTRITRGIVNWLGFKRAIVEFQASERLAGTASYDSWKLVGLAVTSLVTHSFFPLRVVGYLGVAIAAISGPLGLYILVTKFFMGNPNSFTGPAVLAVIIVFLIGIVLACLGLIALYIETISVEVSGRPLYVVRKKNME